MTQNETEPEEFFDPDLAELETLSNGVLDLIENGLLYEAERRCLELKARFPDSIDGASPTSTVIRMVSTTKAGSGIEG